MNDDFYCLKNETIENMLDLMHYTKDNAKLIYIDERKDTLAREKSDKTFDEILLLISHQLPKHHRIIYRKQMNFFPLLSNELYIDDAVEIGLRGIYSKESKNKEYFLFSYLDKEKMLEIKERYELRKLP